MPLSRSIALYWYTILHLKPTQFLAQIRRRLPQKYIRLPSAAASTRLPTTMWTGPYTRQPSISGERTFEFLNEKRTLEGENIWHGSEANLLWQYNLHYFDDLNAPYNETRVTLHRRLLYDWIMRNPPGSTVGWDPYPTSLRIVNWIRWILRGNEVDHRILHSLTVQAAYLRENLEVHLLGNHLLANAKALVFAGLFFNGHGSADWLSTGYRLLNRELAEQILVDGGHFERSPMYHAIVLEDLLDLINLYHCYDMDPPEFLYSSAASMLEWLHVMMHPDGSIPFFNDAALGISADPVQLEKYAEKLGVRVSKQLPEPLTDLVESGYVRVDKGPAVAFLDIAPVGPDYQSGHAHADTLSFELSLGQDRVFVNCGTSEYGSGPRRQWERSTFAHNTVVLDDENSSEIWGSFRVARRAKVIHRSIKNRGDKIYIAGCHNGYRRLPGRPLHYREWLFSNGELIIQDRIEGQKRHSVKAHFHLHPSCRIYRQHENGALITGPNGRKLCEIKFEGQGYFHVVNNYYAAEFGKLEPIQTLCYTVDDVELPVAFTTYLDWS